MATPLMQNVAQTLNFDRVMARGTGVQLFELLVILLANARSAVDATGEGGLPGSCQEVGGSGSCGAGGAGVYVSFVMVGRVDTLRGDVAEASSCASLTDDAERIRAW